MKVWCDSNDVKVIIEVVEYLFVFSILYCLFLFLASGFEKTYEHL